MSNSFLIKEIHYHSLLELSGNYWGKTIMDFVKDQNPIDDFNYNLDDVDLEFLNDPVKSQKLRELLNYKLLELSKFQDKESVKFRSFYIVFLNYIMQFFQTITLSSIVVLPIFLFPLNLINVPLNNTTYYAYMDDKFIVSEEFIRNEFVVPPPPALSPPSAPSGLRITQ